MKKNLLTLLMGLGLTVCAASAVMGEEASPEIPFSGPITTPLEAESQAIRQAPAYDTEEAARYIEGMPAIRELVDTVEDGEGLVCFGEKAPSGEAAGKLEAELLKLSEGDHKVSMIMVDLKTKSGVAWNLSAQMPTQSTVKALYVGAVLEQNPAALEENGQYMREAIEFSHNDSYVNLRGIYGTEPIRRWCLETGVDEGFSVENYPRTYTAREMFKLWTKLYCFLNSGNVPGGFGRYYADSSCSATKKQLGGRFPVQTKAGWECGLDEAFNYDPDALPPAEYTDKDPSNDECAINDTGVVYSDHGPYIFVIYTDHPFGVYRDYADVNPLYNLTEILYEVQGSLS